MALLIIFAGIIKTNYTKQNGFNVVIWYIMTIQQICKNAILKCKNAKNMQKLKDLQTWR